MQPTDFKSSKFTPVKVIYNDGKFSIAIGIGDGGNEYETKGTRFAMRWNGPTDDKLGFPASSSNAMWFQLPNNVEIIIGELLKHMRFDHEGAKELLGLAD